MVEVEDTTKINESYLFSKLFNYERDLWNFNFLPLV